MFKFIVLTALLAVASAHVIAPAANILTKTVHYEAAPVITGHSETILKPKLEIPIVKTAIISEPSHVEVHEPTSVRVGEYVESVPTAVSHQSSTIVHSRAKIVTPIIAPAIKTHIAPVVKTYEAPILSAPLPAPAPIFKTVETAPILKTYESAPIYKSYESSPIFKSYEEAPIAPLHYAAPILSKAVHYAAEPVVTGYSESILKPNLHASFLPATSAIAYAARPEFQYAAPAPLELSKEIHYTEPIISGHSAEIVKPNLELVENSFPYPSASNAAW